jgi:P-type Cu+ transporter
LEAYSKSKTADAITALSGLRPSTAILVSRDPSDGSIVTFQDPSQDLEKAQFTTEAAVLSAGINQHIKKIPADQLEVGDVVRVVTGSSPPADGHVVLGERGTFDESSLTGEAKPVYKEPGDKVYLGTINHGPAIHIVIDLIEGNTL